MLSEAACQNQGWAMFSILNDAMFQVYGALYALFGALILLNYSDMPKQLQFTPKYALKFLADLGEGVVS